MRTPSLVLLLVGFWANTACSGDDGSDSGTGGTGGQTSCEGDAFKTAPSLLSDTGLYATDDSLADGVEAFEPEFALWSDAADKLRFVELPGSCSIDTSDMDHWQVPVGTKLWKEFSKDGKRLETRLIHRSGPGEGDWVFAAYAWNEAETEAELVRDGLSDVKGTAHDIPSELQCLECHAKLPERLLGFSAMQLSHAKPGVTLGSLEDAGRLSHPPAAPVTMPGAGDARQALGYLHANCGNCHNSYFTPVDLRLRVRTQETVLEDTQLYKTTVGVPTQTFSCAGCDRIEPGSAADSAIVQRMSSRAIGIMMPPLGTEEVDTAGVALVSEWIDAMIP